MPLDSMPSRVWKSRTTLSTLSRVRPPSISSKRGDLLTVPLVGEGPRAAGARIPPGDPRGDRARPDPSRVELRVSVRAKHLLSRCVKLPDDLDRRGLLVRHDLGLVLGHGHDASLRVGVWSVMSAMWPSRASRRR